jgi:hypothetical protein
VEDSPSGKLGVLPGDILTHYHGRAVTSTAELGRAKQAAMGAEAIEAVFSRAGARVVKRYVPGALGIFLHPVTKGVPSPKVPPATDVRLDFSSLRDAPRDEWLSMSLGGREGVGFEHHQLRLENGKLHLRREVAFDGGQQWGINHMDCTVVASADAVPSTLRTTFENVPTGMRWTGTLGASADGQTRTWRVARITKDGKQESTVPVEGPLVAEYLLESLAAFLPRVKGTCLHVRMVSETNGPTGRMAALFVSGEEEFTLDGKPVKVWRVQRIEPIGGLPEYGRIAGHFLVDGSGRVVHADYGGARATLTTKARALEGLHPEIEVRTEKR